MHFIQSKNVQKYITISKSKVDISNYSQASIEAHKSEKLFVARMSKYLRAGYDNEEKFGGKVTILYNLQYPIKLLLSLLNSKLLKWWSGIEFESSHLKGRYIPFSTEQIKKLPIPTLTTPESKQIAEEIEELVNKILRLKQEDTEADTGKLEKEIDRLVYELYGLSEEEVGVIEQQK